MNPKCVSLIESLEKYSITGLTEFLAVDEPSIKQFFINVSSDDIHHATMMLLVTPQYIEIGTVERLSNIRGIIKDLLYIVACKAVDLNLPIQFKAEPGFSKRNNMKNSSKLYKYYNNLGFTLKNKNKNNGYYNTNVNQLRRMITRSQKKV